MNLHKGATRLLLESLETQLPAQDADQFQAIKESAMEKESYIENTVQAYSEAFGGAYDSLGPIGKRLLKEDMEVSRQVMRNNMNETLMNETTDMRYLVSTNVTTMRKPMEANVFRIYDTQAAESSIVTIETLQDTLTNAENQTVNAFSAFDDSAFIDTVEKKLQVGTDGIVPGATAKNKDLLTGHNKGVHRLDTNVKITGIEFYKSSTKIGAQHIKPKKGYNPFFDSKDGRCDMVFIVDENNGSGPPSLKEIAVSAKIDFGRGVLEFLNADEATAGTTDGTAKVFFDMQLAHDSHQNAITVSTKNHFKSVPIPTSPHFEVSESIETLKDVGSNESGLKGKDFISILSDKMVQYSAQKEDLILFNELERPYHSLYKAEYDYNAPSQYAAGSNFEWIKLNFVNLIDLVCTSMKRDYHVKNAEFRIALSPIMLRIIDNGYALGQDESLNSVLNYSVVAKTAANTMIFVSSERFDDKVQVNMILTDRENPIVKTFDYWKYQSFLTDALQSSKNATRKAVVFSERNLPLITEPVACQVTIKNLPHKVASGNRFYKQLG